MDQSGMGGPTSSYTSTSIAPWLIRPLITTTIVKVMQSLGGVPVLEPK
jgi:hypothetical protein